MGCDIHYVIEMKDEELGWVGIFSSEVQMTAAPFEVWKLAPIHAFKRRNYYFFGKLAGVRSEGPEPNGLPEDASDMSKIFVRGWGRDGHSHGYCSLEDFISAYLQAQYKEYGSDALTVQAVKDKLEGVDPVSEFAKTLGLYDDLESPAGDIHNFRVVFWFDN